MSEEDEELCNKNLRTKPSYKAWGENNRCKRPKGHGGPCTNLHIKEEE
jgi:hypothetical protein